MSVARRATRVICAVALLVVAERAQAEAPLSTATEAQARVQQRDAAAQRKREDQARIEARDAEAARQKVQADLKRSAPSADVRTNFQTYRSETLKATNPRPR